MPRYRRNSLQHCNPNTPDQSLPLCTQKRSDHKHIFRGASRTSYPPTHTCQRHLKAPSTFSKIWLGVRHVIEQQDDLAALVDGVCLPPAVHMRTQLPALISTASRPTTHWSTGQATGRGAYAPRALSRKPTCASTFMALSKSRMTHVCPPLVHRRTSPQATSRAPAHQSTTPR